MFEENKKYYRYLTLTNVVFEYIKTLDMKITCKHLTLTNVVFEFEKTMANGN